MLWAGAQHGLVVGRLRSPCVECAEVWGVWCVEPEKPWLPLLQAPAGRAQRPAGPFKEAIVFMVGGGNYLEYESLR